MKKGTHSGCSLFSALVRPGRFDMQVTVPRPDVKGRTEILNWYLSKIKVDPGRSRCKKTSIVKVDLYECIAVYCWVL